MDYEIWYPPKFKRKHKIKLIQLKRKLLKGKIEYGPGIKPIKNLNNCIIYGQKPLRKLP